MSVWRVVVSSLLLAGSASLPALQTPGQDGAAASQSLQPQDKGAEPRNQPETTPVDRTRAPATPRPSGGNFVPSERIEADSAVSFPVDI